MRLIAALFAAALLISATHARAAESPIDPRTVQRFGPAYRYPQAGWIVLHIEGAPYERGIQHGRLLAPEIAAYVRCLAMGFSPKTPTESWDAMRNTVNAMFLRGYTPEQLQEMKGIADGASAAGARFDDRPIDLVDIVAINSADEMDSLDAALKATPTGIEGLRPPKVDQDGKPLAAAAPKRKHTGHCCAFAACGPATKDGKIVFGHITMFDVYRANFYNIWLDIKPDHGHHFVMQTYPAGMQSSMDYSISDAGLLMSETTLDQTQFEIKGTPLASRARQAIQYADTLQQASDILSTNSNGLSTTEWILADAKRNEIALLTLGTHQSTLHLSSKKEWIAGAEGFYWSCNNNKDLPVRLEELPGLDAEPSILGSFTPSKRDSLWLKLYSDNRGKIDADFARRAVTTPALVAAWCVDAKYTTGDMAGQFKTWAMFGPPVGPIHMPSFTEQRDFPEIKPLIANSWTTLDAAAPLPAEIAGAPATDLHDPAGSELGATAKKKSADDDDDSTIPAWHGTLLPKTDADIWLTTAFANYERIVAIEAARRRNSDDGQLTQKDLDELGVELFYHRSYYELGWRAGHDVPLAKTHADPRDENWYRVASGKGVLLLHTLRGVVGADPFDRLMDEFGRANAGKEVTAAQFQIFMEKGTGKNLAAFFDAWLNQTGLPHLELGKVESTHSGKKWTTKASLTLDQPAYALSPMITVETVKNQATTDASIGQKPTQTEISSTSRPLRVVIDKHGLAARSNGGPFTILTFDTELDDTLIVYGTLDETVANSQAAQILQQSLRRREHNITVPIVSDAAVNDEQLKSHHLLLIGRPDSNRLVARFADSFPVTMGTRSFEVRGKTYAHPESALIQAAANPLNGRYSLVAIEGLSALANVTVVAKFEDEDLSYAEAVVLPHNGEELDFVMPAKDLVREIGQEKSAQ